MLVEELYPDVLLDVRGCPNPLLRKEIVGAAIEFCRKTNVWNQFSDPVALADNVGDIDIDVPADGDICQVMSVQIGTSTLSPITMPQLMSWLPAYQSALSNLPMFYNQMRSREQLSIFPIPYQVDPTKLLVMRVSFVPTHDARTIAHSLGHTYRDAIVAGAKARLMAKPGTDWANPTAVSYNLDIFDMGVFKAKAEQLHEKVPGSVYVAPRQFGF